VITGKNVVGQSEHRLKNGLFLALDVAPVAHYISVNSSFLRRPSHTLISRQFVKVRDDGIAFENILDPASTFHNRSLMRANSDAGVTFDNIAPAFSSIGDARIIEEARMALSAEAGQIRAGLANNPVVSDVLRDKMARQLLTIRSGNIGIAQGAVDGRLLKKVAIAGNENVEGFVTYVPNNQRILQAIGVKGYDRSVDAEAKLYEELLSITSAKSSGQIIVFSERAECDSCTRMANAFHAMRPRIKLHVISIEESRSVPLIRLK
jgi:hypothetical protein